MIADDPAPQVYLAACPDFAIGPLEVRPSLRELDKDGSVEMVEPRVMQVLVALAEMEGRSVSRDLLIERCWGGVIVGDDAIQRCIGKLRKIGKATGAFEITTISRIGYRLSGSNTSTSRGSIDLQTKRSIAVRDFRTTEPDSADAIFAQSLADDLCAALASNRDLAVVARAITSALADSSRNQGEIGAMLKVAYVADGTVRSSSESRRITIQLYDAATGLIIWSQKYDVPLEDKYPSDDLLIELTGRLVVQMMREETDRAMQKSSDITAWEAVIRSVSTYRRIALDTLPFAVSEARRAIGLAPDYGAAHAALANALAATFEVGGGRDRSIAAEAQIHCDLAMALDPGDPTVLASTANALGMIGRSTEAMPRLERAVELAPTHTSAYLYLARGHLRERQPDKALQALEAHDRIAPQSQWHYFVLYNKALAHFMAGEPAEAEKALDGSIVINPNYPYAWLSKTLLLMVLDRPGEARQAASRLRQLEGTDSLTLQLDRIAHSYPDQAAGAALQAMLKTAWDEI